jgi:hypothetical protein
MADEPTSDARTVPEHVAPTTGDLAFVQAVTATRTLATDHAARGEEEHGHGDADERTRRWRSLADRADRVLAAIGVEVGDEGHTPAIGYDRLDRSALADVDLASTSATLRALHDTPDDDRIDAADRALADLEDSLG